MAAWLLFFIGSGGVMKAVLGFGQKKKTDIFLEIGGAGGGAGVTGDAGGGAVGGGLRGLQVSGQIREIGPKPHVPARHVHQMAVPPAAAHAAFRM